MNSKNTVPPSVPNVLNAALVPETYEKSPWKQHGRDSKHRKAVF